MPGGRGPSRARIGHAWAIAPLAAALILVGCGASASAPAHCRERGPGGPVVFLPGGHAAIASGTIPGGPDFRIAGDRYRFRGCPYTALSMTWSNGAGAGGGSSPALAGFSPAIESTCERGRPYTLVYGVNSRPADVVSVRTGGRVVSLSRAPIPAALALHGSLAYAGVPGALDEIVVRSPSGAVLADVRVPRIGGGPCVSGAGEQGLMLGPSS